MNQSPIVITGYDKKKCFYNRFSTAVYGLVDKSVDELNRHDKYRKENGLGHFYVFPREARNSLAAAGILPGAAWCRGQYLQSPGINSAGGNHIYVYYNRKAGEFRLDQRGTRQWYTPPGGMFRATS